jgi:hypothetical protein
MVLDLFNKKKANREGKRMDKVRFLRAKGEKTTKQVLISEQRLLAFSEL